MTYEPDYAEDFHERVEEARNIAEKARQNGGDPTPNVEIPVAEDMAERCEVLLEREYGTKIHGLAEQIRKYENDDDVESREEMCLVIAEEFATGKLSEDFDNNAERVEAAIRTAISILTEGVVAAPIEGMGVVEIDENDDGSQFLRIPYYGPIRSAGGTAQAVSVLVADYVRDLLDIAQFKPRDDEVERYVEEIYLYDNAVGMQYCPPKDKLRYIIRHVPIMIDGIPNSNAVGREVDGYRDLERIEGNHPRDGMCLVVAEGIGLKAPKLQKYAEAFELSSWDWLDKLITGSGDDDEESEADEDDEGKEFTVPTRADDVEVLEPSTKYLGDVIAGRPIFADPAEEGAFRLRYGRSRTSGHAAVGFSPATMIIVDDFIATSTQIKTERPGKAAGAVPVDGLEGPTVRLDTGELIRIDDIEMAKELDDSVEEILDLGEIGVPYGEFVENNHPLAPAGYSPEWWEREYEDAGGDATEINHRNISLEKAISITEEYDNVPLHPEYTYLWHDIEPEEYAAIRGALNHSQKVDENTIQLPSEIADILGTILIPHHKKEKHVEISKQLYDLLEMCVSENPINDDVLGQVNQTAPFTVRPRALTRIGGRMGRPEKAERREMKPYVHSLFPIRDAGGNQRRVDKAAQNTEGGDDVLPGQKSNNEPEEYGGKGVVKAQVTNRKCPECGEITWQMRCPNDNTITDMVPVCSACGTSNKDKELGERCKCGQGTYQQTSKRPLNVNEAFRNALDNVGERVSSIEKVKGVKRLTSDSRIPEPLEKGILRAKYDVSVFRDGTARYDMCDLPITSFKPNEIGATVEQVKELGYEETIHGEPITSDEDMLEMKIQDVIVNEKTGEYLVRVSKFIDELLVKYYDMDPYYNAEEPEDLIGTLMIGMAPHTSAGVVGRLIGYTRASANYAHPFFHAAKRRNCFHPDMELNAKINGEWKEYKIGNLVEQYLTENADDSYDDGSIVQSIEEHPDIDELKVPSMTEDGHRTIENVTHLSKHVSPEHMVTIETDGGDELKVTQDHKIPVKSSEENNLYKKKKACNVEQGDELFNCSKDDVNEIKEFGSIDLLEKLLTIEHDLSIDNLMIRGLERDDVYELLIEEIKPKWDGRFYKMKSSCEYLDITKKELDNYMRRESIPVKLLIKLYDGDLDKVINNIPDNIKLGRNSDNVDVPRNITLDEELACLIGYYTSEGYTRLQKDNRVEKEQIGSTHTDFAASIEQKQKRQFIKDTLRKKFDVENPYTDDSRITVSGNLIRFFFNHVLDSGRLAHTKEIPEIIEDSPDYILGAYLNGYISGDGSMSDSKYSVVSMNTVSEKLKDDLIRCFNHLDISVNIYENEPVLLREKFPEYYDDDYEGMSRLCYSINLNSTESSKLVKKYGIHINRKEKVDRKYNTSKVVSVEPTKTASNFVYDITVENTHKLEVEGLYLQNCDGDEDSVMLLMDGFLNFSKDYLPSQRGKNMMDAPVVMSAVINPEEIDDEAHNVDIVEQYPRELYEATMHAADPDDVDIELAEDRLENPTGFKSSLSATSIDSGPKLTAYKTLGGMQEKLDAQLALADSTRGVDERRVASLVVEKHFFPDIIGNLTAFSRQEMICGACGSKARRASCSGRCLRDDCPGGTRLTVYEGMVTKYVDMATELAEKYSLRPYTQQRLSILSNRIDSLFLDDKEEQVTLDDYL